MTLLSWKLYFVHFSSCVLVPSCWTCKELYVIFKLKYVTQLIITSTVAKSSHIRRLNNDYIFVYIFVKNNLTIRPVIFYGKLLRRCDYLNKTNLWHITNQVYINVWIYLQTRILNSKSVILLGLCLVFVKGSFSSIFAQRF